MPIKCCVLLLVACAALPAGAQKPTTPAMAKRILGALADDSMQGRATGSPGAMRAARMIADEMKRIGLDPLGDSGYFQRVPIAGDSTRALPRKRVKSPADTTKFIAVPDSSRPVRLVDRLQLLPSLADRDTLPVARRRPAVNVLGVIRGSDASLAAEHVLVDAHYDHLGMQRPAAGPDSIYNGADDDASGVTAVLEIARQFREGPRPKRTVIFSALIGEETGGSGNAWYTAHPPLPLAEMVANLEIEMIERPDSLAGGPGRAWLTGYERSTMGDMLAAAGIPIVPDRRLNENFFMRSDNIAFARRGIVAHTLSTFNLHADYHQVSDEVGKADFDHMAAVINAAARATRLLTDGPKPAWKPGGKP